MLTISILCAYIIVTFIVSPLSFFAIASAIFRPEKDSVLPVFAASIVFGPPLLSFYLYYEMMILPGHGDGFYVALTSILLFLPLLLFVGRPALLSNLKTALFFKLSSLSRLDWALLVLLAVILLSLLVVAVFLPLSAHDISSYFGHSKAVARAKDFSVYPLRGYEGIYTRIKHPPGFFALWVWQHFIFLDGRYDHTIAGKMIAPCVAILTCMSMWLFADAKRQTTMILAAVILVCTPMLCSNIAVSHIDVHRCSTYLGAAFFVLLLLRHGGYRPAIVAGLAIGLASRSHFSSLLVGPLLAVGFLLASAWKQGVSRESAGRAARLCLVMGAVAVLVCGFDYGRMVVLYGDQTVSTEESHAVQGMADVDYGAYVKISRGISGTRDKIVNGWLKGFTDLTSMGVTYWLALLGVIVMVYRKKWGYMEIVFLSQVLLFMLLLGAAVALGNNIPLKNARYFLAFQPFIAFLAAKVLEPLYEKVR